MTARAPTLDAARFSPPIRVCYGLQQGAHNAGASADVTSDVTEGRCLRESEKERKREKQEERETKAETGTRGRNWFLVNGESCARELGC